MRSDATSFNPRTKNGQPGSWATERERNNNDSTSPSTIGNKTSRDIKTQVRKIDKAYQKTRLRNGFGLDRNVASFGLNGG